MTDKIVSLGFVDGFYSADDYGSRPDKDRPVKLIEVSTLIDQAEVMLRASLTVPGATWTKFRVTTLRLESDPNYACFNVWYYDRQAFNFFVQFYRDPQKHRTLFIDDRGRGRVWASIAEMRIDWASPGRLLLTEAAQVIDDLAEIMRIAKELARHLDQYSSGAWAGGIGWYAVMSELKGDDDGKQEL